MFNAVNLEMVLIADKSKIIAESNDELFYILNNLLFYNPFIHIQAITFPNFFHIDEVEQVFVFEHHHGFLCL